MIGDKQCYMGDKFRVCGLDDFSLVRAYGARTCTVAVYYSSIKHHKLKRIVELKEREVLEILKNHFGKFYKFNY